MNPTRDRSWQLAREQALPSVSHHDCLLADADGIAWMHRQPTWHGNHGVGRDVMGQYASRPHSLGAKYRRGAPPLRPDTPPEGSEGAALVEFAIALPVIAMVMFSLASAAYMGLVTLVVDHAAWKAARAATRWSTIAVEDRLPADYVARSTMAATLAPFSPEPSPAEDLGPNAPPEFLAFVGRLVGERPGWDEARLREQLDWAWARTSVDTWEEGTNFWASVKFQLPCRLPYTLFPWPVEGLIRRLGGCAGETACVAICRSVAQPRPSHGAIRD